MMNALVLALGLMATDDLERVLVMDLQAGKGIDKDTAQTFTDFVVTYTAEATRYVVVSKRDIARIADLEADKQQQGCDNSEACMAEIGGALGARYVVFGRISRLGSATFVHLTVVDSSTGQPVTRKVVDDVALDGLAQKLRVVAAEIAGALGPVRRGAMKKAMKAAQGAEPTRVVTRSAEPEPDEPAPKRRESIAEVARQRDTEELRRDVKAAEAAQLREEATVQRWAGGGIIAGSMVAGISVLSISALLAGSNNQILVCGAAGCTVISLLGGIVGGTRVYEANEMSNKADVLDGVTDMAY